MVSVLLIVYTTILNIFMAFLLWCDPDLILIIKVTQTGEYTRAI